MQNTVDSLNDDAIFIIGTPNITSQKYASAQSQQGHINLKSEPTLRKLTENYFKNVLIFSMNDEVVHLGFYPMANYLIGIGIGKK